MSNEWHTNGSDHYKTKGGVEPIDLYESGNMFQEYAILLNMRSEIDQNLKELIILKSYLT
jgi:hypothetical protein